VAEPAPAPARPGSLAELRALVDVELGPGPWLDVTQERIDAFARATEDFQWIHVDPERAAATPLGTTIAHGLLTLSLGPVLMSGLLRLDAFDRRLNYGYDKVRFPAPVPAGSRLRMRATIVSVDEVPGGSQITTRQTIEREGGDKPVCVAVAVARLVGSPA
jgi:acyl dehydratase